ncbi:hypothetical protein [Moorena producens]|uniref:hypothetical protein n=1 Tax=Moorena producens TaxID=1155739 RepID=UPI003C78AAD5
MFDIDTSCQSCYTKLLPFAFCLLPFAFCLLPVAFCLLPFACSLLPFYNLWPRYANGII